MIPYERPSRNSSLFDRAQDPSGITFSKRFDNEKIKRIRPMLEHLPRVFEEEVGEAPKLPRRIYTMTQAEARRHKAARSSASLYEAETDTVRIDPAGNPHNILLNVIHEMLHADLPWLEEQRVKELGDKILGKLRLSVWKGRTEPTPLGFDATRLTKGLWIGSKPEIGRMVAESGFDLLVLCAEEYQPPAWQFPGVEVIHAPFDDSDVSPTAHEKKIARSAAKRVVDALEQGSNVLVSCYAGRNRSGLVCGLALVATGYAPVQALRLIQDRRKGALTNQWFVDLLTGS